MGSWLSSVQGIIWQIGFELKIPYNLYFIFGIEFYLLSVLLYDVFSVINFPHVVKGSESNICWSFTTKSY